MRMMIQEYERCRAMLSSRIHDLNAELRENPLLRTKEREMLERRKEMLTQERIELLHAIMSMRAHYDAEEGCRDEAGQRFMA
ncbi:MAG: hypothetical protein IJN11_01235 [Oscillospiraceae bacterium]|nr:hypothetical protein [Ruminococcus sp.]MBQ7004715.1 hypothetical protein [Oscillospiraceae bacterium]MBQ7012526.1 hypothetical protein [Oscillospiraceae bacterium]